MNDFLDNLADRAMYAEQSVRPRLSSLFEPVTAAAQSPRPEQAAPLVAESLELNLERETGEESSLWSNGETKSLNNSSRQVENLPSIETTLPEHPDLQSVTKPRSSRVELKEPMPLDSHESPELRIETPRSKEASVEREHPAVEDEMVRQIVRSIPRNSLERPPESTLVESPPQLPVRSTLRPPGPLLIQPSPSTIERDRTAENQDAPRALEHRPYQAKRSFSPSRMEARGEPIEDARAETTTVQPRNTHTEVPQVVRPNLADELAYLMSWPVPHMQGHSSAASEHVINVTIGRIEVRATATPSPPPRAANQKLPVMSLDEYLQRRAGGGRGGGV